MVEHHSGPLPLRDPRPGITFAVDPVEPASEPLPLVDGSAFLQERLGHEVLAADPGAERLVACRDAAAYGHAEGNAFTDAVYLAYCEHRPLVLSPDVVWLTLAQGVAQHVRLHAEHLRERLVAFQGRREIEVERHVLASELTRSDWAEVIDELAATVARHVDMEQLPPMLCTFSTTTTASRVASQVVLLDGLRRYVDLTLWAICGIPQITLLGAPADWADILGRTSALDRLGLGWWTERLRPILEQLVTTAEGRPDQGFWQRMYALGATCGAAMIDGWFAHLFPYVRVGEGPPSVRNPVLTGERSHIQSCDLPNGLSRVPLLVKEPLRARRVALVAGLTGIDQDPATHALTPVIGWAVTERGRIERALEAIGRDPRHRLVEHGAQGHEGGMNEICSIPAGVVELFESLARVELFADDPSSTIVLHAPVDESDATYLEASAGPGWICRWGIDIGQGPAGSTLCCVDDLEEDTLRIETGIRRGCDHVDVIADSFEDFLERVLAEGAYFAQPGFRPLRTLVRRRYE